MNVLLFCYHEIKKDQKSNPEIDTCQLHLVVQCQWNSWSESMFLEGHKVRVNRLLMGKGVLS